MKKPFYKNIWFYITIALILCIINIIFACKFTNRYSNLFTAISGWISGVATIAIGIIAANQGKKYEEENRKNRYINEIQQRTDDLNSLFEHFDKMFNIDEFRYISLDYLHEADDEIYVKARNNLRLRCLYARKAYEVAFLTRRLVSNDIFTKSKNNLCLELDKCRDFLFMVSGYFNSCDLETSDKIVVKIKDFLDELDKISDVVVNLFIENINQLRQIKHLLSDKSLIEIENFLEENSDMEVERLEGYLPSESCADDK